MQWATSIFLSNNCLFIFLQGFCLVLNFAQSLLRQTQSHHPPLQCYLLPQWPQATQRQAAGTAILRLRRARVRIPASPALQPCRAWHYLLGCPAQSHLHPWPLSRSAHTVRHISISRVIWKDLITPTVCLSRRVKSQCSWRKYYLFFLLKKIKIFLFF